MSRSQRRSHARQHLSRQMLLPMPPIAARNRSLRFHAHLMTVQKGFGTAEHLVQLASLMYIAWFLQRAGYGSLDLSYFHEAEQHVEIANRRGMETDSWTLDEDAYPAFERILALHDQQLDSAPTHAILAAEDELMHFIAGNTPSPLPASTLT